MGWRSERLQSTISYAIAAINLNDERVLENALSKEFTDEDLDNAQAMYD